MNKVFIFFISFFLIFTSCKKIDKWTQFTMEYNQDATIKSALVVINLPYNIPTPNITTNSESTFDSNNTHKDLVEEARLEKLTLTVISPEEEDFSFLESVKVYIEADGLDEVLIAQNTTVSDTVGATIEIDSEGQNLEAYIKKDEIKLRVETVTDEILTQDYTIRIHSEFFIDAKILGI